MLKALYSSELKDEFILLFSKLRNKIYVYMLPENVLNCTFSQEILEINLENSQKF